MAQLGTAGTAGGMGASAREYAKKRGISPATLERLGVEGGSVFFPTLQRKADALFWPYRKGGQVVNWKATCIEEKAFTGKPGGEMCLHHVDDLADDVVIVEGEWDMAALVEAGLPVERVTTVPNGASGSGSGYGFIEDSEWNPRHVTLATDADEVGGVLRQTLAKIFGAARCSFVEWPEGCKDANDMLRSDGPEALKELVTDGARPWPVVGLYTLSDLPEPPQMTTWHPGFAEWEGKVLLAPGTMSVVTGHPGHGKTQFWMQVWQQVCQRYDLKACIASFETRAKPHHRRTIRSLLSGRLERDMTPQECKRADDWINDHYLWLHHPDQRPTLEWLLDAAEVAVVRHGAKIVQIDPWNRLESQRENRESETDYIGRCLTAMYVFAQDFNVHLQILAHPAKMDSKSRNQPPLLEDIAGSKHWDNRVDQGFTVHRPQMFDGNERKTDAVLYHRKARFEELGFPCKLNLRFDVDRARYISTDFENQFGDTP